MKLIGYFRDLPNGRNGKLFSQVEGEINDTHIPLFTEQPPEEHQQRIVAAANRYGDLVVVGVRHHCPVMGAQLRALKEAGAIETTHTRDQGFVDNFGNYHSREDALKIAIAAGQINVVRPKTSPEYQLFSEDLY